MKQVWVSIGIALCVAVIMLAGKALYDRAGYEPLEAPHIDPSHVASVQLICTYDRDEDCHDVLVTATDPKSIGLFTAAMDNRRRNTRVTIEGPRHDETDWDSDLIIFSERNGAVLSFKVTLPAAKDCYGPDFVAALNRLSEFEVSDLRNTLRAESGNIRRIVVNKAEILSDPKSVAAAVHCLESIDKRWFDYTAQDYELTSYEIEFRGGSMKNVITVISPRLILSADFQNLRMRYGME